jgi:hypothetical protein
LSLPIEHGNRVVELDRQQRAVGRGGDVMDERAGPRGDHLLIAIQIGDLQLDAEVDAVDRECQPAIRQPGQIFD